MEISTEDLQEDFKTFGKRCFGYISDEFLEVLARGEKLTDNELETMIHKADRPISSDELVKMMVKTKVSSLKTFLPIAFYNRRTRK